MFLNIKFKLFQALNLCLNASLPSQSVTLTAKGLVLFSLSLQKRNWDIFRHSQSKVAIWTSFCAVKAYGKGEQFYRKLCSLYSIHFNKYRRGVFWRVIQSITIKSNGGRILTIITAYCRYVGYSLFILTFFNSMSIGRKTITILFYSLCWR